MIITGPGVEVNKTNSNLPVYGMRVRVPWDPMEKLVIS